MKKLLLTILTVYERIISPLLHQLLGIKTGCRNNPTCSSYAQEVIEQYGVVKGFILSMRRVLSCQPFFSL